MKKGLRIEELRATNYVRDIEGIEGEVSEIGNFSYFSWIEEDWSGIPLTEDWLLRFGFNNLVDTHFYKKQTSKKYYLLTSSNQGYTEICVNNICGGQAVTKYVHQLQNLYFALTGEELV